MSAVRMLAVATWAAGAVLPACAAGAPAVTTLYSFTGGMDGSNPYPGLIKKSGTFLGTTTFGGTTNCPLGCGVVYSITPAGSEFVMHSFTGGADGAYPGGTLLDVRGLYFGTTASGGDLHCNKPKGCGTVFVAGPEGFGKVLYAFKPGGDGKYPAAGLTRIGSTLYGTTTQGGAYNRGTVFSVTLAGDENILYS